MFSTINSLVDAEKVHEPFYRTLFLQARPKMLDGDFRASGVGEPPPCLLRQVTYEVEVTVTVPIHPESVHEVPGSATGNSATCRTIGNGCARPGHTGSRAQTVE